MILSSFYIRERWGSVCLLTSLRLPRPEMQIFWTLCHGSFYSVPWRGPYGVCLGFLECSSQSVGVLPILKDLQSPMRLSKTLQRTEDVALSALMWHLAWCSRLYMSVCLLHWTWGQSVLDTARDTVLSVLAQHPSCRWMCRFWLCRTGSNSGLQES